MLEFCEKLELNVGFLQDTMPELIENFKPPNADMQNLMIQLKDYLARKNNNISLPTFLKENEKQDLFNFFSHLGKHDANSEQKIVMAFKQTMANKAQEAEEYKNKNAPIIFKLATFIGLALAIIIY